MVSGDSRPSALRGEVWLVGLDPTVGSEIRKSRPALVISPDEMNASLRTVAVAPMTTGSRAAPFRVPTAFAGKAGFVLLDQVRTVDRLRVVRRLGLIVPAELNEVLAALQEMFAN